MKYLLEIIKKNKGLMSLYVVLGIVIAFLNNYSAQYFERLIDGFGQESFSGDIIIGYGIVLLLLCLCNYLDEYPNCKLEKSIYFDLKQLALKKISKIDYESYQSLGTGMLIQRVESGACAGKGILFDFGLCVIRNLLPSAIFSLIFIGKMSQVIIICVLVGYVLVFFITNLLLKSLYRIKANILVNEEAFNKFLVRGFMEVIVFRMNKRFEAEISKTCSAGKEITEAKVKMRLIHEAFFASFTVLIIFIKIGIIYYGWKTNALSIGAVIALITLVDHAYTPIAIFNVIFVQYKLDQTAFKRYTDFLDMKEDKGLSEGEVIVNLEGKIEVSHLDFSYGEKSILRDLSLELPKGQTIAFVGESGSGKSTLIKLILGLLKPTRGTVLIDEKDIVKVNLQAYYEQLAYISQESPVFDGTLRENLVFDKSVADEHIIEALEQVGLSEFLIKLEEGLDTKVGEKGVMLSGGERQRLALARLYFSTVQLVILDEVTSAMDNLTEKFVMERIMNLLKGKTVIIIAHRLSSIQKVDQVVLFKEGRILGQGKFGELLKKSEYFKALYYR